MITIIIMIIIILPEIIKMVNSKLFGFALEPRNAWNYFYWRYPFEFRTRGEKNANTVPRTSNYHFVKLLATAIATFLQETVNADPKKLLICIRKNCQCGSQWIMNADPNEQLMRIPVVKILSFSLRNGHGVVVGLVRLLVVVLYQVILYYQ